MLMANWNWMLPSLVYGFEGVDGLKTGYTDAAKYCFTGTATKNGMRVITVVMGAENEAKRFSETKKLMTYGFTNFKMQTIITQDQVIEGFEKIPVRKGKELEVEALSAKEVSFPVRIGEEDKFKPSCNSRRSNGTCSRRANRRQNIYRLFWGRY